MTTRPRWTRSGRSVPSARRRPAGSKTGAEPAVRQRRFAAALIVAVALLCPAAAAADKVLDDSWSVVTFAGKHSGYSHSRTVSARDDAGRERIRTEQDTRLELNRMGAVVPISTHVEITEDADARMVAISSRTETTGLAMRTAVVVDGAEARVSMTTNGQETGRKMAWDRDVIGPWAEQQLLRKNLAAGRAYRFKTYIPDLVRSSAVDVKVGEVEATDFLGAARELRRVETSVEAMPQMPVTTWVDEKGEVMKSSMALLGRMETYRVTREEALREVHDAPDLMAQTFIRPNAPLPDPAHVVEALYRMEAPAGVRKEGMPPEGPRQTVEERGNTAVVVRVRVAPPPKTPDAAGKAVDEKYSKPGPFIQSDDAEIVALAERLAAGAADRWQAALRMQAWVTDNVKTKDLSVGFGSAKETLKTRTGDCTEHAVLLAALCRAVGIPTRLAVGVAYWNGIFAYHMWVEAHIGGEWATLDAALPGPYPSAARIKLIDTAMEDANWGRAVLDIAPLIGQLKITILEYRIEGKETVTVKK